MILIFSKYLINFNSKKMNFQTFLISFTIFILATIILGFFCVNFSKKYKLKNKTKTMTEKKTQ